MLASVLLDLAHGKLGPHKGSRRFAVLQAKAKHILDTSALLRAKPRTVALELEAALTRQLCDELLANHVWHRQDTANFHRRGGAGLRSYVEHRHFRSQTLKLMIVGEQLILGPRDDTHHGPMESRCRS
jgi:hypothetical protein